MKQTFTSFPRLGLSLIAVLSAFPCLAQAGTAGQFQFVSGDVRVLAADGRSRTAHKGQDLNEGDTVVTGANASAQLKMIDGGILALRPDSQLKMDAYVFKGKEDGSEKAKLSLVKGGLRAISGLIGKTNKQNYAINTPTATIGIRGTDHEPVVVLPPQPGQPAPANPPGTYDKVNVGSIVMQTQAGAAIFNRNQVGFAGSPNQIPALLPRVPSFYQVTPQPGQARGQQQGNGEQQASARGTGDTTASSQGSGSTTTSASGSENGESMRVGGQADAGAIPLAAAGGGTLPGNGQAQSSAPSSAPEVVKTGKDGNGNDADLSRAVTKGPSGEEKPLETLPPVVAGSTGTRTTASVELALGAAALSTYGKPVSVMMSAGKLTSFTLYEEFAGAGNGVTVSVSAATPLSDFGQHAGTGMSWGRWHSGTFTVTQPAYSTMDSSEGDSNGTITLQETIPHSGMHWLAGTKPAPEHLSRVLTGSYDYSMVGGTNPTDVLGNVGVLQGASLKVDFTNQLVKEAIVRFSMGSDAWKLKSTDAPLTDGGRFFACTYCPGSDLKVEKNSATANVSGYMLGSLTGHNLEGASLNYVVSDIPGGGIGGSSSSAGAAAGNAIQGVVGLGAAGSAPNASTAYRYTGVSGFWKPYANSGVSGSTPDSIEWMTGRVYNGSVDGGPAAAGRVLTTDGKLTEFLGMADYLKDGHGIVSSGGLNSATVRMGSAVNADAGSASMGDVTVSWGRWEGGVVDVLDRSGSGASLGTIDNRNSSIHWLVTNALAGAATSLPLSGRWDYSLAGGTTPTDTMGNRGVLNSATVSADFSKMQASASVDLTINATQMVMNAQRMAITAGGSFNSGMSGPSITCNGNNCGGSGYINGQFLGANAAGAAINYGMAVPAQNPGLTTAAGTVVSGVAVLKQDPVRR